MEAPSLPFAPTEFLIYGVAMTDSIWSHGVAMPWYDFKDQVADPVTAEDGVGRERDTLDIDLEKLVVPALLLVLVILLITMAMN